MKYSSASSPQAFVGGAVNDVPPDATAYPHRHQNTLVIATVFPPHGGVALDTAWRGLAGRVDGGYVGFESRPGRDSFARTYPDPSGERVRRLRRHYDPDGVFRANSSQAGGAGSADG